MFCKNISPEVSPYIYEILSSKYQLHIKYSTCYAKQAKHVHFVLYVKVLLLYGIPSHTVKALLRIKNIRGSQTRLYNLN